MSETLHDAPQPTQRPEDLINRPEASELHKALLEWVRMALSSDLTITFEGLIPEDEDDLGSGHYLGRVCYVRPWQNISEAGTAPDQELVGYRVVVQAAIYGLDAQRAAAIARANTDAVMEVQPRFGDGVKVSLIDTGSGNVFNLSFACRPSALGRPYVVQETNTSWGPLDNLELSDPAIEAGYSMSAGGLAKPGAPHPLRRLEIMLRILREGEYDADAADVFRRYAAAEGRQLRDLTTDMDVIKGSARAFTAAIHGALDTAGLPVYLANLYAKISA